MTSVTMNNLRRRKNALIIRNNNMLAWKREQANITMEDDDKYAKARRQGISFWRKTDHTKAIREFFAEEWKKTVDPYTLKSAMEYEARVEESQRGVREMERLIEKNEKNESKKNHGERQSKDAASSVPCQAKEATTNKKSSPWEFLSEKWQEMVDVFTFKEEMEMKMKLEAQIRATERRTRQLELLYKRELEKWRFWRKKSRAFMTEIKARQVEGTHAVFCRPVHG